MTGGDPLRKVRPGEPLAIPASTWNAFVDALIRDKRSALSATRTPLTEITDANVALVRNESGADRARFEVLGIDGPIIKPADNLGEFQHRVGLKGVVPASSHAGRFAVLLEPVASGSIGRASVAGVCPVKVRISDETDAFADVQDGVASELVSGPSGSAGLLWVEPVEERTDPAVAWTVVRVGLNSSGSGGSSGATTSGSPFLAKLTEFVQFDPEDGAEPRYKYHWQESEFDAKGSPQLKLGGRSSKPFLKAAVSLYDSNGAGPTLASPADGEVLFGATIDADTSTGAITIRWNKLEGAHDYYCQVGSGTPLLQRNTYHGQDNLGDVDTLTVSGLPIDGTNFYIRLYVDGQPTVNWTRYEVSMEQTGEDTRYRIGVSPVDSGEFGASGTVAWASPADGTQTAGLTITPGEPDTTDLAITWSPVEGATNYEVYVGRTAPANMESPPAYDIYDSGYPGDNVPQATLPGIPADGTAVYVILWATTDNWATYFGTRYRLSISPPPDRKAVCLDEANRMAAQALKAPAAGGDVAIGSSEPTPIENDVYVWIIPTTDAAGNTRYFFEHLVIEWFGLITDTGPLGTEDDYTDERYWVKRAAVSNAGPDNGETASVDIAAVTGALAQVVTVTNLAEKVAGTHALAVDTPVIVRTVRGGDAPHVTRYAINIGARTGVFPVNLIRTGGSQGTATAKATWTYNVIDPVTNQTLASGVNPTVSPHKWKRPSAGWMLEATFGYAHFDPEGQLVIGWINEMVEQQACVS